MGRLPGSKNKAKEETAIDTSEGGLVTTQPPHPMENLMKTAPWVENPEYEERIDPTVNTEMNFDPMATPAAALIAVGRFYNDAGTLSAALSKHMRTTSGEPELFAFLQRLQTVIGDLRAAVEQIESGISEHLRNSIEEAVA